MNRTPTRKSASLAALTAVVAALLLSLLPRAAHAYPTMIRYEYFNCVTCHTSPTGASLLTEYGRAQSDILLSTRWGKAADAEPSKFSGALFGLLPKDSWFNAGGWLRDGFIVPFEKPAGGGFTKVDDRVLQMRWELAASVKASFFRAYGSLGVSDPQASLRYRQANITNTGGWDLVGREYWLGAAIGNDALVRAGRMSLPFGLGNAEHTAYVRDYTRTDFNVGQQHGIAFSMQGERYRGEVMAVLGNFQVHPDAFRDRGYAALFEWRVAEKWAAGVSSSVLRATKDLFLTGHPTAVRQAHGLVLRGSPFDSLTVLAEANALINSTDAFRGGFVGWLQADEELFQGFHVVASGEVLTRPEPSHVTTSRYWLTAWWFAYSHFDLRIDGILEPALSTGPATLTLLAQANIYL